MISGIEKGFPVAQNVKTLPAVWGNMSGNDWGAI